MAYNIPEIHDKAKALAREMFYWRPRLPALREMLQAKRLVTKNA